MKRKKLLRTGITVIFVLLAVFLVYLVVRQTMPDIIPLLKSGDEAALEAYLSRDMSPSGILYMALLQMVQVWSIVISGVIVNVAAGVVYGVWRAFAICLLSSSLAHGISFTLYQRRSLLALQSWMLLQNRSIRPIWSSRSASSR